MIPLPEPSSFTPITVPEPQPPLPTPPHGSTSSAGQLTTANSLQEAIARLQSVFVPTESREVSSPKAKPLPPSIAPKPELKAFTPTEKGNLAMMLSQVCAMQKAYGKAPADLEVLVEGYCLLLDRFRMEQIVAALKDYMLRNEDIPSAASIAKLIDPSLQPLCTTMVARIRDKMRSGSVFVTDAEREYMRQFEAQELAKVKQTA